jgi:hypothetical protein
MLECLEFVFRSFWTNNSPFMCDVVHRKDVVDATY